MTLHKRTVASIMFPYRGRVTGPDGQQYPAMLRARKGDPIEVDDEDLARGEEHGAFESTETRAEAAPAATPLAADMSDDELVAFISEEKPSVPDTVALANEDPEQARRVLAAEEIAKDGDPRQTLVTKLEALLEQE